MVCRVRWDNRGTSSQPEDFFCFEDLRFLEPGSIPAASTIFRRFIRIEDRSMGEKLIEIARRVEGQPWNRPGTDKTWVLNAMSARQQFEQEVREAKRVRAD